MSESTGLPPSFDGRSQSEACAGRLDELAAQVDWLLRQRCYFELCACFAREPSLAGLSKVTAQEIYVEPWERHEMMLSIEFHDGRQIQEAADDCGRAIAEGFLASDPKARHPQRGPQYEEALDAALAAADAWLPGWRDGGHPIRDGIPADPSAMREALFTPEELARWEADLIAAHAPKPEGPGAPRPRM